jgi:hypothetical protein
MVQVPAPPEELLELLLELDELLELEDELELLFELDDELDELLELLDDELELLLELEDELDELELLDEEPLSGLSPSRLIRKLLACTLRPMPSEKVTYRGLVPKL